MGVSSPTEEYETTGHIANAQYQEKQGLVTKSSITYKMPRRSPTRAHMDGERTLAPNGSHPSQIATGERKANLVQKQGGTASVKMVHTLR